MEHTTRRLRKYEADSTSCSVATDNLSMECFSPFGPIIARFKLPQDMVDRINAHADSRIASDKSTEFLLSAEFVTEGGERSLVRHMASLVRRNVARRPGRFRRILGRQPISRNARPVHFHSGDVAGVLYLKVPEIDETEEARSSIAGRQPGYINFLIGGKQRLSRSLISFKPKVGELYLFPGWLLHVAEPFRGSGERRSMAFNAVVGDES